MGYNFADKFSEGTLLIDTMVSVFKDAFDNNWYPSHLAGTFSNFMKWATHPDGYYYLNSTFRGLAAAGGAINHKIFLQYDNNIVSCHYSGYIGQGKINLSAELVSVSCGLLLLLFLLISLNASFYVLVYQIKDKNVFQLGAQLIRDEKFRIFYSTKYLSEIIRHTTFPTKIMQIFNSTVVRMGQLKTTVGESNPIYFLGPLKNAIRIKSIPDKEG